MEVSELNLEVRLDDSTYLEWDWRIGLLTPSALEARQAGRTDFESVLHRFAVA